jgi:hypothetical protein
MTPCPEHKMTTENPQAPEFLPYDTYYCEKCGYWFTEFEKKLNAQQKAFVFPLKENSWNFDISNRIGEVAEEVNER